MTARVEARTRLIRPMTRETVTLDDFERSHWRKATREEFAPLWEAECARVPEFSESAFHVITGLLLPIWDRLPAENMRVYRFETDDGERVIGRLVTPEALDRVYRRPRRQRRPGPLACRKPGARSSIAAPCSISPAVCRSAARW